MARLRRRRRAHAWSSISSVLATRPSSGRAQALAGIKTALTTCAPGLDDPEAEDIAAVVLNNMKTMVAMTTREAPTTAGAPNQLRLMTRLYLAARLGLRRTGGAREGRRRD